MKLLDSNQVSKVQKQTDVLRIIYAILICGPFLFAVPLFFFREHPKFNLSFGLMTGVGIAYALANLVASYIVPMKIWNAGVREIESESIRDEDQAITRIGGLVFVFKIVQGALIEGSLFSCLVLWLVTGSLFLIFGAAICLLVLIVCFPSTSKLVPKVESALKEI